ncbi:MAG TPA: hypothetical protein PK760_10580, partial [Flavobacteriales bacterium]|nr:hypothetical protein [Flavobacteriales bacterium]
MIRSIIALALFVVGNMVAAQTPAAYDSTFAKKVGADDYGMRHYTFVLLTPGARKDLRPSERDSVFSGHMANIG